MAASYEYSPPMQYEVICDICGKTWLEQDPGVRFVYSALVWECSEEAPCLGRRAMLQLDQEVNRDSASG